MTIRNFNALFRSQSIAVIGASNRPRSVGQVVMRNLLAGGFSGPIMPVNPRHKSVAGVFAYPDVEHLPTTPDLAVICTPPQAVPDVIKALANRGTKAAIILTAGLSAQQDGTDTSLIQATLEAAQPHLMRILGPNCVGLIIPELGLNASFAQGSIASGKIAFVSQSGALATSILDWSRTKRIGFSHFISLGEATDIDFGDTLDYLASDPKTDAILLYIEAITASRKFMSAARAAARNKPVVVVKAGRAPEGARAAASHTGALAAADDVFDAAIRRAGMLRVYTIHELFDAVETLARAKPPSGNRLAILTNGGGPGVMAADALSLSGGTLASLSKDTLAALDCVLPSNWSQGNPIDIIGDAPPERYVAALEILLRDQDIDAILFIHAPTAIVPSREIAQAIGRLLKETEKTALGCWLGGDGLDEAESLFANAGIATYETPEMAVAAFLQLINYQHNQRQLMETPSLGTQHKSSNASEVREIITKALETGREMLTEPEAKQVLAAYGIPVVETCLADTPESAAEKAIEIGFPVALKILSPDISHKSDVGGVVLDLANEEQVLDAAINMNKRVRKVHPTAKIEGFTVQKMAQQSNAHEVLVGAYTDPVFGPVVMFGQGGTAVEVVKDRAVALPPLNSVLARELISQTRISRLLKGYRNVPPTNLDALSECLVQISQLIADIPEIMELDINPLFANAEGILALDARIKVSRSVSSDSQRFAIRPYPQELEEWIAWDSQRILLRPIRPEDEPSHSVFFKKLSPEDISFRFFGAIREMPHSQLARFTQIDYDREMAFVAVRKTDSDISETLGVARAVTDPNNETAEFAIVVRSDLSGRGLGKILLEKLIGYLKSRGTITAVGETYIGNTRMLALARQLGFQDQKIADKDIVRLQLDLQNAKISNS
ncbi:MAG: bifunctional acetate--CoA ligase family protein/GNAT family N-acetyltransferase [Rhodospirillaceae bacterium]